VSAEVGPRTLFLVILSSSEVRDNRVACKRVLNSWHQIHPNSMEGVVSE